MIFIGFPFLKRNKKETRRSLCIIHAVFVVLFGSDGLRLFLYGCDDRAAEAIRATRRKGTSVPYTYAARRLRRLRRHRLQEQSFRAASACLPSHKNPKGFCPCPTPCILHVGIHDMTAVFFSPGPGLPLSPFRSDTQDSPFTLEGTVPGPKPGGCPSYIYYIYIFDGHCRIYVATLSRLDATHLRQMCDKWATMSHVHIILYIIYCILYYDGKIPSLHKTPKNPLFMGFWGLFCACKKCACTCVKCAQNVRARAHARVKCVHAHA